MVRSSKIKAVFFILFFVILSSQIQSFARKTIYVLAIGNSFSVDAAEAYLDDLAKAADIEMVIGNCNIGGCSLQRHWSMVKGDSAMYSYRKIINGDSTLLHKQTLKRCLLDEKWDYITFQQVSHLAGIHDSFFPYIINLKDFVSKTVNNKKVKYAFHQTWAYASNSTHTGFRNYNNNQLEMYNAVVKTIREVAKETGIKIIIPSGTGIQNGRTCVIGDNFCRDGFHLSLDLGRYTAACVWFEVLTGKSVLNNKYKPATVSSENARIARIAAHNAVKSPFKITENK